MDTAVPTTSPYAWADADAEERASHGLPSQSMDGGPQVSQPPDGTDALPVKVETSRATTVRRVATGAVGLGLVAAAVLASRGRRKARVAEPVD